MLQIQNIKKQYKTGYLIQQALDNVSLSFRDSEFVSILGPKIGRASCRERVYVSV